MGVGCEKGKFRRSDMASLSAWPNTPSSSHDPCLVRSVAIKDMHECPIVLEREQKGAFAARIVQPKLPLWVD